MADEQPGLGARRLAFAALEETLRVRRALDDVLAARAPVAALEPRDLGLARAIAVTALRRLGTIRAALAERLSQPVGDPRLEALLVAGAAQILFLDVPDHAAVATAVDLAREERRLARAAGLINAVLRRVARERDAVLAEAEADPLRDAPTWLAARWVATYGEASAAEIARAHRREAALDLTVKGDPQQWVDALEARLLPTGTLRVAARAPVPELPGYAEGAWWVQDAAAALPATLLGARPGMRIADLCAAPGGKTAQLAAAGADVLAVDRSAKRLERLSENLARLGLGAETRAVDALALPEDALFDAVLLDAPCSSTGTLRRHPDVAWTKDEGDVAKLAALQARLLDKAAAITKPGGVLVYCTCSLEPEEGEAQAAAFLARHQDFAREPIDPQEIGCASALLTADGDLRVLPHLGLAPEAPGLDGFYATRLRKR
ncbi:RsmB/NOP family class I SAM-dependent RNA methyltransferase [Salinarimonas ramus]|uniref:MFS transporter n=1 Tax=Salinarimonas ramus TaxID=690164 RepID=A0A917QAX6_9HYPH|nr:transcription antitermination factor NusB [Salinarimonas ramus]GGK40568.1 MFS transporter [Salinarimonas ramus]